MSHIQVHIELEPIQYEIAVKYDIITEAFEDDGSIKRDNNGDQLFKQDVIIDDLLLNNNNFYNKENYISISNGLILATKHLEDNFIQIYIHGINEPVYLSTNNKKYIASKFNDVKLPIYNNKYIKVQIHSYNDTFNCYESTSYLACRTSFLLGIIKIDKKVNDLIPKDTFIIDSNFHIQFFSEDNELLKLNHFIFKFKLTEF